MEKVPFNEKLFKQIAGDCEAEYVNFLPRGKNGLRSWEIKAVNADGTCKVVVFKDCGVGIKGEVVELTVFENCEERNELIYNLYHEKGLSQVFLAELFHMSQPSVSLIVNKK